MKKREAFHILHRNRSSISLIGGRAEAKALEESRGWLEELALTVPSGTV